MNYFGNYINFMTSDEYLTRHDPKRAVNNILSQEIAKVIYFILILINTKKN